MITIFKPHTSWIVALLLITVLISGCATTSENPIETLWLPFPQNTLDRVSTSGISLKRQDGTVQYISHNTVRNLTTVMNNVEKISGVNADLGLVDTDYPNAFAFHHEGRPVIAISLSWLKELGHDKDALATTIGHELAHLHLGHTGDKRKEREQIRMGASQVLGTLMNIAGVPMGGTIASIGVTAFARSFTRDEERAADDYGIRWAVAAGYDPCGRARTMKMYQRMQADEHDLSFLSTHPGATERSDAANDASLKIKGRLCSG